jgi:hypothetical protein
MAGYCMIIILDMAMANPQSRCLLLIHMQLIIVAMA